MTPEESLPDSPGVVRLAPGCYTECGSDRDNVLGNQSENIRNTCRTCTEFIPGPQADMTVLIASDEPHDGTVIYLHTGKALKELLKEIEAPGDGLQSLVSLFSTCIGCRGCREACPLCSCILCDYETARTLHSPELVRAEAKRKGSLRVPTGTLQFQLGRLMHIAPLCTACGQCSDVCPVDIPVSDVFIRAANLVQKSLNYFPGRDTDDTPPMATYVEKELLDITD